MVIGERRGAVAQHEHGRPDEVGQVVLARREPRHLASALDGRQCSLKHTLLQRKSSTLCSLSGASSSDAFAAEAAAPAPRRLGIFSLQHGSPQPANAAVEPPPLLDIQLSRNVQLRLKLSTRMRKREHEGASDSGAAAEDPRAPPAKAAAIKRAKRAVEDTRASPSPSSPDDFDDAHGDEDHGHDAASRGLSGTPEWVFSIFSEQKRAQWDEFLRTKCLARVGADFYDLFELAIAISEGEPLEAFTDTLGIQLCGLFDLLALAICEKKQDVSFDKPLFLHGRLVLDPPEVTTVLKDASNGVNGAHWGYFRDAPEQTPEYIVFAKDSSKCSFQIAGSSLFHVLDFSIQEQLIKSPNDQGLEDLATKVKQYLRFRKLPARVTPANLSRKRASQATAASLHKLGIVVPYNAKKQTGFRELPVVGDQLAALLQDVQEGNTKARKALSGLITRATIANDECDFGTSLLLGLDLFTAGEALEKESLQLLRVAYMLLRRLDFYKIVSAQTTHRRVTSVSSSSSSGHNPPHMLTSIVTAPSGDNTQPSSNLGGSTQVSSSHVTDASQPKITTVSLP